MAPHIIGLVTMNIFYLDECPIKAASMHCDKHVVKMILEYAQLLSTAHHIVDGCDSDITDKIYKPAYVNHPSNVWVRQSSTHYAYLELLFSRLCVIYSEIYGRVHATETKLLALLSNPPKNIANTKFIPPPQCMPDIYKHSYTRYAYLRYYSNAKRKILKYKSRIMPAILDEVYNPRAYKLLEAVQSKKITLQQ